MAKLLYGAPVAQKLCLRIKTGVALLRERGVIPTAGIIRVGESPADLSYERGFTRG